MANTPTEHGLFQKPARGDLDWDDEINGNWDAADAIIAAARPKNLIINGNFQVWQRGDSHSSNGFGSADRWRLDIYDATATMTKEEKTVGQVSPPTRSPNVMRLDFDGSDVSNGAYIAFQQFVEDMWVVNNRQVSVCFWAKADGAPLEVGIELVLYNGQSQYHDVITPVKVTVGETDFAYYTATFDCPDISGYTLYQRHSVLVNFWVSSNNLGWSGGVPPQAGTLRFSNISMAYGDGTVRIPERSYSEELKLCQRYFQVFDTKNASGGYTKFIAASVAGASNYVLFPLWLKEEMWVAPSVTFSAPSTFYMYGPQGAPTSIAATNSFPDNILIRADQTISAGSPAALMFNNTDAYIRMNAEI